MSARVKVLIAGMIASAVLCAVLVAHVPTHPQWIRFLVYVAIVLLSAGLKVSVPFSNRTMSVNFPFILLGVLQLSPAEAVALAAISVTAQCRFRGMTAFSFVQVLFNVSNSVSATGVAVLLFRYFEPMGIGIAPAVTLAAAGYFFANTVPMALVIGWTSGQQPSQLWRTQLWWYMPFYLVGAVLAAAAQLISLHYGWVTSLLLIPVVYAMYQAFQTQAAGIRDRQRHIEEMEALHLRTIEGLAMAIEAKDQNTHEHLLRVRVYVSEIGRTLGVDDLQMKALLTASFLHDIGKLAVPEALINKPGKLTPDEFEKMKIHPVVGADILARVRFPYPVVPIVRSHHEAWDGSGYPDGLKGEEIPIGARILSVVDCFDALASDRPYRKALPLDKVMEIVKGMAGTAFDPKIVAILEQRYVELEELARKAGLQMTPLATDIVVARGAAPAAGYQQDSSANTAEGAVSLSAGAEPVSDQVDRIVRGALGCVAASAGGEFTTQQMIELASQLKSILPFECMGLYSRDGDQLLPLFVEPCPEFDSEMALRVGEGLSGWAAQTGSPVLNGNPKVELNYREGVSSGLHSGMAIPLYGESRRVAGVLALYARDEGVFATEHMQALMRVESSFARVLPRSAMGSSSSIAVASRSLVQAG